MYLLKFFLIHASSVCTTARSPLRRPSSLSTSHARGIFSSLVRPPVTPATQTSVMSRSGCTRSVSSTSFGETCAPETLSVSFARSTKLPPPSAQKDSRKPGDMHALEQLVPVRPERVAGAQPAVDERLARRLLVAEVA